MKNDNLLIKKEVKGSEDEDYSLFGHTTPDGDVTYRFNLTNTTNEVIEQFTFLDVLPSVGDLGITDNKPRDSKFPVTLTGPISFSGTKWEDQVTVYYSESKNPKRDDLYETVDFPEGSSPYPNPEDAEDPNWQVASDVTDWAAIHSFKIVMKDGIDWLEGQDIEFEVDAKAPALPIDKALFDPETPEVDRAAWNSYAVTTNGLLAVEPLRVGVVMDYDIEEPKVEKTVNNQKDTYELIDRDEEFTWKVDYAFGNYTADWESAELSDQIHELLEIMSYKVIDQDGNDVASNGTLTEEGNLVKFVLDKQDGSFNYLENEIYTLEIKTKIKESATDEELEPFIESNGIPNEGVLNVNDNPITSNEVFVKPPGNGSLEITKVENDSDKVLPNAEFELRDENDVVIATGATDENGKIKFEDLPLGNYQIVETKAPDGYRLLTKPIDVEITPDKRHIELKVENYKSGWELPDTDGIGTYLFYGIGSLVMLLGLFIARRRRLT